MTKKLRHKFIAVIMSIVTVMLIIIMAMICFFTRMNLEHNSILMMQNIADDPFLRRFPDELPDDMRLPYFTIQLGIRGELVATGGGYYDLSDEHFLKNLIAATFSADTPIGVIEEYNLRFFRKSSNVSQTLVYADISSELTTLRNLIRNCILIGIACFFIFLCISILLAGWMVRPVENAWRQQQQFIADASHELKTPLTVIMTNAELLRNADDEAGRRRFLSGILVMSGQMRDLVEQMLVLARADAMPSGNAFSSFDFSRLILDAILTFEPVFFEKGLTLHTAVADHVLINGDPSGLRQVLDILLDNAQKYSRESGAT